MTGDYNMTTKKHTSYTQEAGLAVYLRRCTPVKYTSTKRKYTVHKDG